MMLEPDEVRQLLPRDKFDLARARQIAETRPDLPADGIEELFTWLQDYNWPVTKVLVPYLASLGEPSVAVVSRILTGDDPIWKYWVLLTIVDLWPVPLIREIEAPLSNLRDRPTTGERAEEVPDLAAGLLSRLTKAVDGSGAGGQ